MNKIELLTKRLPKTNHSAAIAQAIISCRMRRRTFYVVLFNPKDADVITREYVRVKGIYPSTSPLKDNEPIYEEGPFDYLFQQIKQKKQP